MSVTQKQKHTEHAYAPHVSYVFCLSILDQNYKLSTTGKSYILDQHVARFLDLPQSNVYKGRQQNILGQPSRIY